MMKETIDLFGKILTNILTVLYEPFGFSLLLSFLAMFFYLYAYEPTGFRDIDDLVPNAAESEPVAKSFVKCHGWLGHLGDREQRAETYN